MFQTKSIITDIKKICNIDYFPEVIGFGDGKDSTYFLQLVYHLLS
jgi:hypothetical protein